MKGFKTWTLTASKQGEILNDRAIHVTRSRSWFICPVQSPLTTSLGTKDGTESYKLQHLDPKYRKHGKTQHNESCPIALPRM